MTFYKTLCRLKNNDTISEIGGVKNSLVDLCAAYCYVQPNEPENDFNE